MKNKIFNYAGNKCFCINIINEIIANSKINVKNYIEPFIGSGSIFYNLNVIPQINIINDIDFNIYLMHKSIQVSSYTTYKNIINEIKHTFPDIKNNKETYYNFRNWWNNTFYEDILNKNLNIKAGLYLLYLSGTCLNSILRFGPNGMNQSYGNREYIISEEIYNNCKLKLKNTYIFNKPYQNFIKNNISNCIYFFDPPYESRPLPYNKYFLLDSFLLYLKQIQLKDSLILYTDIENSYSNELLNYGFNKILLRHVKNISPNRNIINQTTGNEVLYWKQY